MAACNVCGASDVTTTVLNCGHQFCADCFSRYVHPTLTELFHFLRCCICGQKSDLSSESETVPCVHRFGRDSEPCLRSPCGLFWTESGHFIITDSAYNRVFIFDDNKNPMVDFAYVHGYNVQDGVVLTNDGHVVLPLSNGKTVSLAYYNIDGDFKGNMYLKSNTKVNGMALTSRGDILVSDGPNGVVYTVNPERRVTRTLRVDQLSEEHFAPYPQGVAHSDGCVIVTDSANCRVRVYNSEGEIVDVFGGQGERPGQFKSPTDVAVTSGGHILVNDSQTRCVQLFDFRGRFLKYVVIFKGGSDSYMSSVAMVTKKNGFCLLFKGNGETEAGEVRAYDMSSHVC